MDILSQVTTSPMAFDSLNDGDNIAFSNDAALEPSGNEKTDFSNLIGCFAQGTLIDTSIGSVPIEEISEGVLIRTFKNGFLTALKITNVAHKYLPSAVCRLNKGYLDATQPLVTLANQPVRLTHWLGGALFHTRFPFVSLGHVSQVGKVEFWGGEDLLFFHLDLGVTDAIFANGVMCIVNSEMKPINESTNKRKITPFDFHLVALHEVSQVIDAKAFFRPLRMPS